MKDFFENPELLLGSPFLVLGAVGLAVAIGVILMYWINPNPSRRN